MSTKVRDTILTAMRNNGLGSETRRAEPVIRAVEEAAAGVAEELRGIAVDKGLSDADAQQILVQVGLVDEAPTGGGGGGQVDAARLERLERFARQHGFRG